MRFLFLWALLCLLSLAAVYPTYCKRRGSKADPMVYFINMEGSMHRYNHTVSMLTKMSLQGRRVTAITEKSAEYRLVLLEKPCKRNTEKEIACIMSHLKAIHAAVHEHDASMAHVTSSLRIGGGQAVHADSSTLSSLGLNSSDLVFNAADYALIIEDDVKILYDIDFAALVASAPPDFGVLQLTTSNIEALHMLWGHYVRQCSGGSSSNSSSSSSSNSSSSNSSSSSSNGASADDRCAAALWRLNKWTDKTKNGQYALFWSAQAYVINKRVVAPLLRDIAYVDNATGLLEFKIVNSFFPARCPRTSLRPCVLSNCLFADTYIFQAVGPTYVSAIPLVTGSRVGYSSDLHQTHVSVHKEAFGFIHNISAQLQQKQQQQQQQQVSSLDDSERRGVPSLRLPSFLRPLPHGPAGTLNCRGGENHPPVAAV